MMPAMCTSCASRCSARRPRSGLVGTKSVVFFFL
jgi:hypothetical protein